MYPCNKKAVSPSYSKSVLLKHKLYEKTVFNPYYRICHRVWLCAGENFGQYITRDLDAFENLIKAL